MKGYSLAIQAVKDQMATIMQPGDGEISPTACLGSGQSAGAPARRWLRIDLWWWAIALVALAGFQPALYNTFSYDDVPQVAELSVPGSVGGWLTAWAEPWWPPSHQKNLWRPLPRMVILVEKVAFGSWLPPYYGVNVLIHLAVCILLYEAAWRLGLARWVAGVGALLFAAHAIHCEAVHQVVGLAELLAAFWMLLGLILYMRHGLNGPRVVAIQAAIYALALASKEHAVIYPLLLMLATASWPLPPAVAGQGSARPRWNHVRWPRRLVFWEIMLAQGVVLLVFFLGKYLVTGGLAESAASVPKYENALASFPFAERLPAVLGIFGYAASRLVWPWRLSPDYSAVSLPVGEGWQWAWTWIGAIAMAGLLVWIVRNARRGGRAWALGVAGLASYLFTSNLFFVVGVMTAERLWYWPSAAACLGLGYLWVRWRDWLGEAGRRGAYLSLAFVCLYLLSSTWHYGRFWRTPETVALRTVQRFPESWRGNTNLAREHYLHENFREGLAFADRAVAAFPDQGLGWDLVGLNATFLPGEQKKAEDAFRMAIKVEPRLKEVLLHLSTLLEMQGRYREALELAESYEKTPNLRTATPVKERIERLRNKLGEKMPENAATPSPRSAAPNSKNRGRTPSK